MNGQIICISFAHAISAAAQAKQTSRASTTYIIPDSRGSRQAGNSMAANTTATSGGNKRRVHLLLAAVLVVLFASPAASARRRPVRLRLYMQDIVGGPGQTAVLLVKGPGPENPSMHPGNYFGDTVAVDDLLTEGLAVDSPPAGRAQGTYMTASMDRPVFVVSVTLLLTAGPYNGSTLVVAGRDDTSELVRELAVVGGTGRFRMASGYVLWSTARVVSPLHAVLELDVHASVPVVPRPTAATTNKATTKEAAKPAMLASEF